MHGLFLLAISVLVGAGEAESRTWTDRNKEFTVKAKYVGIRVVLQRDDGKTIEVPFERLSEKDKEYVRESLRREEPSEKAKQLRYEVLIRLFDFD